MSEAKFTGDIHSDWIVGGGQDSWLPGKYSDSGSNQGDVRLADFGSIDQDTISNSNFSSFSNSLSNLSDFSRASSEAGDFGKPGGFSNFSSSAGSVSSGFAGFGISSMIRDFNNFSTNNSLNQANFGKGPLGSSFDANFYAKQQADYSTLTHNLEASAVSIGSAFGPEGLVAGLGVAGAIQLGSSFVSPNLNQTQGNDGTFTNGNIGNDNSQVQNIQDNNTNNGNVTNE